MNYLTVGISMFVAIHVGAICLAQESGRKKSGTVTITDPTSLAEATAKLNELTKDHPIGSQQPPITVEEIVAAIHRYAGKKIPADKRKKFLAVATTKMLNPGDGLKFSTELWSDDIHVTVWLLDLTVDGYKLRIRDRTISYRPQSALEKEMHESLRKSLEEAMKRKGFSR
jgi:hypothetical protein